MWIILLLLKENYTWFRLSKIYFKQLENWWSRSKNGGGQKILSCLAWWGTEGKEKQMIQDKSWNISATMKLYRILHLCFNLYFRQTCNSFLKVLPSNLKNHLWIALLGPLINYKVIKKKLSQLSLAFSSTNTSFGSFRQFVHVYWFVYEGR